MPPRLKAESGFIRKFSFLLWKNVVGPRPDWPSHCRSPCILFFWVFERLKFVFFLIFNDSCTQSLTMSTWSLFIFVFWFLLLKSAIINNVIMIFLLSAKCDFTRLFIINFSLRQIPVTCIHYQQCTKKLNMHVKLNKYHILFSGLQNRFTSLN